MCIITTLEARGLAIIAGITKNDVVNNEPIIVIIIEIDTEITTKNIK